MDEINKYLLYVGIETWVLQRKTQFDKYSEEPTFTI
jgi:hypothetical protein